VNILIVLPLLVPLVTACLCLLSWRSRRNQRRISALGSGVLLGVSVALLIYVWNEGIQATELGDWPAPFGITLVADTFSAIMVFITGLMGFTVGIYSLSSMDVRREAYGYYPLFQILLMGVSGAFLTGDIFNLFVWFEVMLIASFVMMALGGERPQMEGAIKYVTLNLVASALFLTAVGVLYGLTGTLNMADLAVKLGDVNPGLVTTIAMLFLVAFGIKAAVFPLFFWLPASYHTPPVAVSAIFAALLSKVGVYALIRVFTLLFVHDLSFTHNLILVISAFTMVTGVLGAMAQNEFRRILSFHIISQIGYMTMGLGFFTPAAIAGAIYYLVHNIIAKTNLFLVSGIAYRLRGTYELKELGSLYRLYPVLGVLFLTSAFALAGVPPLSGFFAKLSLVRAGLAIEEYAMVGIALFVSILTLFSMTKIWGEAFWKEAEPEASSNPGPDPPDRQPLRFWAIMFGPVILLAGLNVGMGLFAEPVFALCNQAAEQLLGRDEYIETVLGGRQ
jgi:multicomponent Na+:H+ antiporter subunit D